MAAHLGAAVRALADGPNFAALATINSDGSPQTSVMWVGLDGDDLVFSTVAGRRKVRNMERDPRVVDSCLQLARGLLRLRAHLGKLWSGAVFLAVTRGERCPPGSSRE